MALLVHVGLLLEPKETSYMHEKWPCEKLAPQNDPGAMPRVEPRVTTPEKGKNKKVAPYY